MKYSLLYRYQYWSLQGITYTRWMFHGVYDERKEAQLEQARLKEQSKAIDHATRLKHDYRISQSNAF